MITHYKINRAYIRIARYTDGKRVSSVVCDEHIQVLTFMHVHTDTCTTYKGILYHNYRYKT